MGGVAPLHRGEVLPRRLLRALLVGREAPLRHLGAAAQGRPVGRPQLPPQLLLADRHPAWICEGSEGRTDRLCVAGFTFQAVSSRVDRALQ